MGSILVKVNQMDSIPDIRTCKGKWDEQLTCKSTLDVQQLVNTMDCLETSRKQETIVVP